jgi:DNA polymerase III alpha subunit (gram-positive type)
MTFKSTQNKVKVMFDLETLGTNKCTAPIVSLGAVKFLADGSIIDEFCVNIDPVDLVKNYGKKIEADTLEWWGKQSREARMSWQHDAVSLVAAIHQFEEWYGDKSLETWCHGASFDYPILDSHFKSLDKKLPWKYWHENDNRTVQNMFGVSNRDMRQNSDDIYHDAVADCRAQVKILTTILKPLWNQ